MIVGTLVENRYRIDASLGAGGGGSVFAAEDNELKRVVAIKVLSERHQWDADSIQRFRREAKMLARIAHPNVLQIYSYGIWHDKLPYLVCELADGQTLRQVLRVQGRLEWHRALTIAGEVCRGLKAVHEAGIVHRDLKPENLIVTTDGSIKIIDFGLSKPLQEGATQMTATGLIVGTPAYMSPEQATGKAAVPASDLYALGCIVYEMLCGEPPFTADDALGILFKHSAEQLPGIRSKGAEAPPYVEKILWRACAKSLNDRYRDADDMQRDIEMALSGTDPLPDLHHSPRAGPSNFSALSILSTNSFGIKTLLVTLILGAILIPLALADPGVGTFVAQTFAAQKNRRALESAGAFFSDIHHQKAAVECLREAATLSEAEGRVETARAYFALARACRAASDEPAAVIAADKALYQLGPSEVYYPPAEHKEIEALIGQIARFLSTSPKLKWSGDRGLPISSVQNRLADNRKVWMEVQSVMIHAEEEHPEYSYSLSEYCLRAILFAASKNDIQSCRPILEQAIHRGANYSRTAPDLGLYRLLEKQMDEQKQGKEVTGNQFVSTVLNYIVTADMSADARVKMMVQINQTVQDLDVTRQFANELRQYAAAIRKTNFVDWQKESVIKWTEAIVAYNAGDFSQCVHLCLESLNANTHKAKYSRAMMIVALAVQAADEGPNINMEGDLLALRQLATEMPNNVFRQRSITLLNFTLFAILSKAGDDQKAAEYADATLRTKDALAPLDYHLIHSLILERVDRGDAAGARRMLTKARQLEKEHIAYAGSQLNVCDSKVLLLEGKNEDALRTAEAALNETTKMLGPDDSTTLRLQKWCQLLRQNTPRAQLLKFDLRGESVLKKRNSH